MSNATLAKITELAKEARDKAGQLLASERATAQELARQIETLRHYRCEYNDKLSQAMTAGIERLALSDYQAFLSSLDRALSDANQQLNFQTNRVDECKTHWQNKQQRLSSFNTLTNRHHLKQLANQQRQELKQTDETNNNNAARKSQQTGEK